jgi:hypothetical protein
MAHSLKVYEQLPTFRGKYENDWPIEVYMRRFWDKKTRSRRLLPNGEPSSSPYAGSKCEPTFVQCYIPKPADLDQLLHSTEQDLRRAMEVDQDEFRSMRVSLPSPNFLGILLMSASPAATPSATGEKVFQRQG